MRGTVRPLAALAMLSVVVVAACGGAEPASTTETAAATAAEMDAFCSRYEEVKDLAEKWSELEKVAPPEIKGALFRIANGPSEGYWDDVAAAEEFVGRCDSLGG